VVRFLRQLAAVAAVVAAVVLIGLGGYAVWFLLVLAVGKIAATSLSIGIGGSGGIFAPSLFIGVTSGYAFGAVADHVFGPGAGQPALYAVVAMGAVFTSAARAPLTSLASVVEMSGDFSLTLPVMLAVAIASTLSRALSYGTIYTTKLLRRGTDIDRATPWRALHDLKITDIMQPMPPARVPLDSAPQVLRGSHSLPQALAHLEPDRLDGLPVLSADGSRWEGWLTSADVLRAIATRTAALPAEEASQARARLALAGLLGKYRVAPLAVPHRLLVFARRPAPHRRPHEERADPAGVREPVAGDRVPEADAGGDEQRD
jgi:CIC family chloride channel protein